MKRYNKTIFALGLAAFTLTSLNSCIEETFPESDTATSEQVQESASALEGAVNGISSQLTQGYLVYGEQVTEIDMALPALMIIQSELLGDIYPGISDNVGYDWYRRYNTVQPIGETTDFSFIPWFTLYKFVKSANDVIANVDIESEETSEQKKQLAGIAYACRAYEYYLLTVLYEPVENIYTDVSKVKGLTVPFVLDTTNGEDAKNNPRVPHDEMIEFILSDLDKAEKCLENYQPQASDRTLPSLSVVYGLKAKVYLLDEQYAKAAEYARKAIVKAGEDFNAVPMTSAQLSDPTSAFAKATAGWLWYLHYDATNMGNLCNYTGWVSCEADWGYASLTQPSIDKSLYDHMNLTDYRQAWFLNPKKTDYYDYKTSRDKDWLADAPDYAGIKFRCADGDFETYSIGGANDVSVLRIEELYLIEAEAVGASEGVAAGVALLNDFMRRYRDPGYNYSGSDLRAFQLEVLTQARIESWGEGWAFPSAKRLKPNVIQNYDGTNAPTNDFKINCQGIKPSWTLVIPRDEVQANVALDGYNNPDPSQAVVGPTPVGQFAPANN